MLLFLLIATQTPTQAQVKRGDKPLLDVKKGMYAAKFTAPVLHIKPPKGFVDSLKNKKVGNTFDTIVTEYGRKIGYFQPKIDVKKYGKMQKVNDSLYVFKIHIIVDEANVASLGFNPAYDIKNDILFTENDIPKFTEMCFYSKDGKTLIGPFSGRQNINSFPLLNEYILEVKLTSLENYEKMNLILYGVAFNYFNLENAQKKMPKR